MINRNKIFHIILVLMMFLCLCLNGCAVYPSGNSQQGFYEIATKEQLDKEPYIVFGNDSCFVIHKGPSKYESKVFVKSNGDNYVRSQISIDSRFDSFALFHGETSADYYFYSMYACRDEIKSIETSQGDTVYIDFIDRGHIEKNGDSFDTYIYLIYGRAEHYSGEFSLIINGVQHTFS